MVYILISTHLPAQIYKCGWRPDKQVGYLNGSRFAEKNFLPSSQTSDTVYTLPIVVHVIHTGDSVGSAYNPDDNQIIQMIAGLNKAWRKNGSDFGGADVKIQFQLATRSPGCTVSTGINRVNGGSIPNYVSGGITNYNNPLSAPEEAIKNLSRWPNTDYINIWIVNKINGNSFYPGGYAYFPEYNNALTDGIVLNANVVDSANKTIVHEMGHVFYLYHTFADGGYDTTCAANTDCATQGDLICDTEPYLSTTPCTATKDTCSGNAFLIADPAKNYTVLNNYMGYTDCQWMFTENQKTRVRNALLAYRPGLINSKALSTDFAAPAAIVCTPVATFGLSPYYGVQQASFNTINVYSNSSKADDGNYIDRTCNQLTTVIKGNVYTLSITGSYLNPHRIKAFIDYNNDGDFDDAGENILSAYQGMATAAVQVPMSGVVTDRPLRLRVIADNPALPEPGACQLHGTSIEGAGQAEDYSVIIKKRQILSVKSGPWNVAATWDCNCLPQGDDQVTVQSPHTITITPAMGLLQCGNITIKTGATCHVDGNLKTNVIN